MTVLDDLLLLANKLTKTQENKMSLSAYYAKNFVRHSNELEMLVESARTHGFPTKVSKKRVIDLTNSVYEDFLNLTIYPDLIRVEHDSRDEKWHNAFDSIPMYPHQWKDKTEQEIRKFFGSTQEHAMREIRKIVVLKEEMKAI